MSELEREMEPVAMGTVGVKPDKKSGIGKKIGIFFLILIGLLVLFFIATLMIKSYNRSRYKDEFYLQQEVQEYLQERYNEEFMVMFNRGMSGAYNYVQLYAYPIAYQDEMHKIEIQGYYNKWGKMDFYDDYVMIKLTEEYEAYIDPIIDEYFDEYKFYMDFNSEWMTNNLPADTKLEDLWELRANEDYPLPDLFVYVSPQQYIDKTIVEELCDDLRVAGLRGCTMIWALQDNERYLKLRKNDWQDNKTYRDFDDITTIFLYSDRIEITED